MSSLSELLRLRDKMFLFCSRLMFILDCNWKVKIKNGSIVLKRPFKVVLGTKIEALEVFLWYF